VVVLGTFAQTASVVSLSSSNPSVASVPSTVTVQSGSQTAVFSVSTTAVSTSTTVNITATYNGGSLTRSVTVQPAAPPAAAECHADGDGKRAERRTGDVEPGGHRRQRWQERLGVVRARDVDHVERLQRA
jgi:hypothetical protein